MVSFYFEDIDTVRKLAHVHRSKKLRLNIVIYGSHQFFAQNVINAGFYGCKAVSRINNDVCFTFLKIRIDLDKNGIFF